jgi:hypothetical protein
MEVMHERVAGLDIGKATLTVCVRTPGSRGRRSSETRTYPTTTRALGGDAGLAAGARSDDRGDGVDLDVLEAGVLLPGGGAGGLVVQCRAHQGRAATQDRRQGLRAPRCPSVAPTPSAGGRQVDRSPRLQFWLQLAVFTVIRSRARPYFFAGHMAYGTPTNRHVRDHDGLAVWGSGVRVPSAPPL